MVGGCVWMGVWMGVWKRVWVGIKMCARAGVARSKRFVVVGALHLRHRADLDLEC